MASLRVSLSIRAVVSRGLPFTGWGDAIHDGGVALDTLQSMQAPGEPMVVRVTAVGGKAMDRKALAGDWLCDVGARPVRRIGVPRWTYVTDQGPLNGGKTWLDTWESCEEPEAMVYEALRVRVPRPLVVRAACACATVAATKLSDDFAREASLRAIALAESWSRGRATSSEVNLAANRAENAINESLTINPSLVEQSAPACFAASAAADAAWRQLPLAASAAADAVNYATQFLVESQGMSVRRARDFLGELVRREIPTLELLRAASR